MKEGNYNEADRMDETPRVTYTATGLVVTLAVPGGCLYYGGIDTGSIRLKFRLMQCMLDQSLSPKGPLKERERETDRLSLQFEGLDGMLNMLHFAHHLSDDMRRRA